MASQKIACPRCGHRRRVRHDNTRAECMDCRRADRTPGPEHALEGGYWVNVGGISRYRFYDQETAPPPRPKRRYERRTEHGSVGGYRRHKRNDETPCDECTVAMRAHWREYKTPTSDGQRQPLSPCGTYNAWKRHKRHGEEPCGPCVEASREYSRNYRRKARATTQPEQQSEMREAA